MRLYQYGLLIWCLLVRHATGVAEERVALVIGNAGYQYSPVLKNPHQDAKAVAESLRDLGFAVAEPLLDADKPTLEQALRAFARRTIASRQAVIFFAGHGISASGENYLIPVDAQLQHERTLGLEAVRLSEVMAVVANATELGLVVLDACNDNPLAQKMPRISGERSLSRGLASVNPSGNLLVAYAAEAGTRAADGDAQSNSPYTQALLEELRGPKRDVRFLFGSVRDRVLQLTNQQQKPAIYGTLGGLEHHLGEVSRASTIATKSLTAEAVHWQSTEEQGTPSALHNYLLAYPDGQFTRLARSALARWEADVSACDALAASPYDESRPAEATGLDLGDMDGSAAIEVCRRVAEKSPEPRHWFQYGRALQRSANYAEAVFWYGKAAKTGHAHGMVNFGNMYSNGLGGLKQNHPEAFRWFQKAADLKSAIGMNKLGYCYREGHGVPPDDKAAARWFQMAAEADLAEAMAELGFMYEKGRGVQPSFSQALDWYRKAAEAGSLIGMNNLGYALEKGQGVKPDEAKAEHWYRQAALMGNSVAMMNLGNLVRRVHQDENAAAQWYLKAAEAGNINGMISVGRAYRDQTGFVQDHKVALAWFQKAADAGNLEAMVELGGMYATGLGTSKKEELAVQWYRAAAIAGHAGGMNSLGFMMQFERGVKGNPQEAINWYRKSAKLGNYAAMTNLGYAYETRFGVALDYDVAVSWYKKAIALGSSTAMNNLGTCFENGKGFRQDPKKARDWYLKAAELGNAVAMVNLARNYMESVPSNRTKAEYWYRKAASRENVDAIRWMKSQGLN